MVASSRAAGAAVVVEREVGLRLSGFSRVLNSAKLPRPPSLIDLSQLEKNFRVADQLGTFLWGCDWGSFPGVFPPTDVP